MYLERSVIQEQVIILPDVTEARCLFNTPYAAIEEALSHANKGYDVREPIEVRVLPDKIKIVNQPGAARSISLEVLEKHLVFNRCYCNRWIEEFLKEIRLSEASNSGFRKTLSSLDKTVRLNLFFTQIKNARHLQPLYLFIPTWVQITMAV